jgi:inosine-uridine nucleoside N-ribohydrolase
LEIGNLSCIPVYYGSTYPLINTYERFQAWEAVHGVLPWQGVFAPYNATAEATGSDPTAGTDPNRIAASAFPEGFPNITAVANKSAAAFMIEQVHKYPGQVSIYAAGAMTNVALAVRMDDQFASLAKELVIMGGYVDVGMLSALGTVNQADINSDINLMIDPESSKIALTADFPNIVIAGNVANQVISTQEFLDEIYEVKNPYSKLMYEYYGTIFPFWDETAAALMVDPTLATNTSTGE